LRTHPSSFTKIGPVLGLAGLLWSGSLLVTIFGCGTSPPPRFEGQRAYRILKEQCDLGPRQPNSAGHAELRQYLLDRLSGCTGFVKTQEFVETDPIGGGQLRLTNIIASFYPEKSRRLLLGAHWDTRPIADHDPNPALRKEPIPGANDGASGVAVLLEIARVISQRSPAWGVDIVFFDGEDSGREEDLVGFCLGSIYFAAHLGNYRPKFAIVVDMIGDRDLRLYKEGYSYGDAPEYVELIWSEAKALGLSCFVDSVGYFVYDDHVPLQDAGIPAVDLIDLDYPYWHTMEDTPDKCSPESLQKIGDVLVAVLYHGG
jgi:glutaminyl-peptide cyclotransferase